MKLQRITRFQGKIHFPNFDNNYAAYLSDFQESDLGKIDRAIPWRSLVKNLKIRDKKKGPQSIFSPKGKLALMFLKHYASCSDKKLIEQLNANIHFQFFCDIYIPPGHGLKNFKIVSEIRTELGRKLNIEKAQKILADHWRPYCTNLNSMTFDATCYESNIRYPTDTKLLWESLKWSHTQLRSLSKQGGRRMLRTK